MIARPLLASRSIGVADAVRGFSVASGALRARRSAIAREDAVLGLLAGASIIAFALLGIAFVAVHVM